MIEKPNSSPFAPLGLNNILKLTDSYSPNGAKAFGRGRKPPGNRTVEYQPRRGESAPPMIEKPGAFSFAPLGLSNISDFIPGAYAPGQALTGPSGLENRSL